MGGSSDLASLTRAARKAKHLSQAALGAAAGMTREWVNALEHGHIERPDRDSLVRLARAVDERPSTFLRAAGYDAVPDIAIPDFGDLSGLTGAVIVPIITSVSAGGGYQHDGVEIINPPAGASRHLAGFRVRGDCMVPAGISDGDVVIVDLAADWSEGRVVLARVGDDLLVKRVFYGAALNSVVLRADAEGYADISDPDTYVLGVVLRSSKAIH